MNFKFRGSIKNSKEVVDIFRFEEEVAVCGDGINRHIDEFNTIFYPAQTFKSEILNIIEPQTAIKDSLDKPKSKKSK